MIGQLHSVVLDCAEPSELARFYGELLGASVVTEREDWVTIEDGSRRRVSFQRAPHHKPPTFPDPGSSQQLHLDVMVDEIESAERAALQLGAVRLGGEGEDFRVYADPAGHPFCLVWRN
jgi:catechol 2,3-dioxygenase-like lactoylglutathione lyase family enzyme